MMENIGAVRRKLSRGLSAKNFGNEYAAVAIQISEKWEK